LYPSSRSIVAGALNHCGRRTSPSLDEFCLSSLTSPRYNKATFANKTKISVIESIVTV